MLPLFADNKHRSMCQACWLRLYDVSQHTVHRIIADIQLAKPGDPVVPREHGNSGGGSKTLKAIFVNSWLTEFVAELQNFMPDKEGTVHVPMSMSWDDLYEEMLKDFDLSNTPGLYPSKSKSHPCLAIGPAPVLT